MRSGEGSSGGSDVRLWMGADSVADAVSGPTMVKTSVGEL